jgi:hypothetical protein
MYANLRTWLGLGVLGPVLVAGCSHAHHQSGCCDQGPPGVVRPAAYTPQTAYKAPVLSNQIIVLAQEQPQAPAPPPEVPAIVAESRKPEPAPTQVIVEQSVEQRQEAFKARRSFADITADPCFAHASDYTWLQGELQYLHGRNAWRVRYASVDEEDRYGGGVTLVGPGLSSSLKDGQMVRVTGRILDTDSHDGTYRADSIEVLHR